MGEEMKLILDELRLIREELVRIREGLCEPREMDGKEIMEGVVEILRGYGEEAEESEIL